MRMFNIGFMTIRATKPMTTSSRIVSVQLSYPRLLAAYALIYHSGERSTCRRDGAWALALQPALALEWEAEESWEEALGRAERESVAAGKAACYI